MKGTGPGGTFDSSPARSAGLRFLKAIRPEGTIDSYLFSRNRLWTKSRVFDRPFRTDESLAHFPALRAGLRFLKAIRPKGTIDSYFCSRSRLWTKSRAFYRPSRTDESLAHFPALRAGLRFLKAIRPEGTVSYTHLTLPTICSV